MECGGHDAAPGLLSFTTDRAASACLRRIAPASLNSVMNPLVRWFHQLGSPPYFDRFAARWSPWCYGVGLAIMLVGLWGALFNVCLLYTSRCV